MLLFGSVHRVTSAKFSRVSTQPRLLLMCLLMTLSSVPALAQNVPKFGGATQINFGTMAADVPNTSGPVIVNFNGTNLLLFVQRESGNNIATQTLTLEEAGSTIPSAVPNAIPFSTGIVCNGLGQVKATVLNGILYVSYINDSGRPALAKLSSLSDGFTLVTPNYTATVPTDFVPTIFAFNGELWAGLVASADPLEVVFDMSSDGGTSWTQESVVTGFPPISNISLADFNGVLYAAYTTSAASVHSVGGAAQFADPVFGSVLQGQPGSIPFNFVNDGCCFSSTSNGSDTIVTAPTLIGVPGEGLYLYTQSPSSNDEFFVTATSNPGSTSPVFLPNGVPNHEVDTSQSFRWDFSAALQSDNSVVIAYQQSGATNIDFTTVASPAKGGYPGTF
jgi:hypothetical protein